MTCVYAGKGVIRGRLFFYLCAIFCVLLICTIAFTACDESEEFNIPSDVEETEIVFMLNNGDDDVVCKSDDPFPRPTKEGYLFDGWYLDSELNDVISEEAIVELMQDRTSDGKVLRVYAKWNKIKNFNGVIMMDTFTFYDGEPHLPKIDGLPEGASVIYEGDSEYINAGEYEVSAVVSAYGYYDLRLNCNLTIAKAEIDASALTFEDSLFVWDGLEKSIEIMGDLPSGVSVSYIGNGNSDVGVYTVTARFDVGENYQPIEDMNAVLTITEKLCAVTFVEENGDSFVREVGYGKSLDDIPEPAAKRGYSGSWSGASLENICENIIVHAVYEIVRYAIEYHLNGGALDGDTPSEYTVESEVDLPVPYRAYYSFVGWFESEDLSDEALGKIYINSVGEKHLYAKWSINEYTVIYVLDGGVNNMKNTNDGDVYKYSAESDLYELADPSKTGYAFVRWYDEHSNTVETIDPETPANLILYAEWTATVYAIEYKLAGGVNGAIHVESYTVDDGEIILPLPIKIGYDFSGWHMLETLDDESFASFSSDVAANVTLYAEWTAIKYNIMYELNGGDNSLKNTGVYTVDNGTLTLDCAFKVGYDFMGWYKDSEFFTDEVTELNALTDGEVTLFAKWEAVIYIVSYELYDGINGGGNPTNFTIEDGVLALHDASKDGFEFKGWYMNPDFDGEPVVEINGAICESVVLYAKWEKISGGDTSEGEQKPPIGDGDNKPSEGDNSKPSTGEDNNSGSGDNEDDNIEKRFTIENIDGKNIITACDFSETTEVIIPSTVDGIAIDGIKSGVLSGATSIVICEGFICLDGDVFSGCTALKNLVLPSTIESLSHGIFSDCIALESLTVPFAGDKQLTSADEDYYPFGALFGMQEKPECYGVLIRSTYVIGGEAVVSFDNQFTCYIPSSLKKVTVLDGNIMGYAFFGFIGLKEIEILGGGIEVYECAFRNCASLETLKLPVGVTALSTSTVLGCSSLRQIYVGCDADAESIKSALPSSIKANVDVLVYDVYMA